MSTSRVKDSSFIQMHIEKLALGIGLLVLVVAFVLFVVGSPYTIQLGSDTFTDPNAAFAKLESDRARLEAGINDPDPIPDATVPNFRENYAAMMQHPVITGQSVERFARAGLRTDAITPDLVPPPRYAQVTPPAPQNVQTVTGADVLDTTFDPGFADAMFKLWGERREPADFTMFVASADFDIWEWYTRLKNQADNANKIPAGIWAQRFGIAGVAILREEKDPYTGEWTNRVITAPLPNQVRYLPGDTVPTDAFQAITLIQNLRQAQERVARPELPYLDTGIVPVQAAPPGGDRVDGAAAGFDEFGNPLDEENLGPNEQRIRDLEAKIAQLEQRRQERDERRRPSDQRQPPERNPRPGGGGFDDFGDGGGTPRDTGGAADRDPFARQIEQLRRQIEQLRPRAQREAEERRKIQEQRRLLEEQRRAAAALRGNQPGGFEQQFGDRLAGLGMQNLQLQEGATIRVWAADPNMEPGKTYRYKVLVAVINPLYGVPRLEPEQLAENQGKVALFPSAQDIEAMPWSKEVYVEPRNQFFFASGSERGAKVDVYRRVAGIMQKQTFDVSPGDRIGSVVTIEDKTGVQPTRKVDMSVGALLVDIDRRRSLDGQPYYALIYMDSDGTLHERSSAVDSASEDRRQMDREAKGEPQWPLRPDPDASLDGGFNNGGFDDFGGPGRF